MTAIQIFALIGVFLIGAIFGGYATFKFFRFALQSSTVVDPLCMRRHITISTLNATASLGVSRTRLEIAPRVADWLEAAMLAAPGVDEKAPPS